MEHRPDLQFGLSEEELIFARKALRLEEDAMLSTAQYHDWCLVRDTWLANLTGPNSHAGGPEQRRGYEPAPEVVTKRKVISMEKYRR